MGNESVFPKLFSQHRYLHHGPLLEGQPLPGGLRQATAFKEHPTHRVAIGSSSQHSHFFLHVPETKTLYCFDPWRSACAARQDRPASSRASWNVPQAIHAVFPSTEYTVEIVTRPPEQCDENSCQLVSLARAVFLCIHSAADPSLSDLLGEIRRHAVNKYLYVAHDAEHWALDRGFGPLAIAIAVLAFSKVGDGASTKMELFEPLEALETLD